MASATHELETVDGIVTVESVGCDGCDSENVRITDDGMAYERDCHGTYVRHSCGPMV